MGVAGAELRFISVSYLGWFESWCATGSFVLAHIVLDLLLTVSMIIKMRDEYLLKTPRSVASCAASIMASFRILEQLWRFCKA